MSEHLELHQLVDTSSTRRYKKNVFSDLTLLCSCPYLGIFLATLSSLFFSLCSVIVKELIDVNPMELAAFR